VFWFMLGDAADSFLYSVLCVPEATVKRWIGAVTRRWMTGQVSGRPCLRGRGPSSGFSRVPFCFPSPFLMSSTTC
jgi:hypothetical protein